jgi:hypothetical protein
MGARFESGQENKEKNSRAGNPNFFKTLQEMVQKWKRRWNRCVNARGAYLKRKMLNKIYLVRLVFYLISS